MTSSQLAPRLESCRVCQIHPPSRHDGGRYGIVLRFDPRTGVIYCPYCKRVHTATTEPEQRFRLEPLEAREKERDDKMRWQMREQEEKSDE